MDNSKWHITRRGFLIKAGIGTGLAIGLGIASCEPIRRMAAQQVNEMDWEYDNDSGPRIWFEILPDSRVRLHSPKVEMGQGVFTGLAVIAAEELYLPPEQIEVVHATTSHGPVDPRGTGASDSTSSLWFVLRELAATVREMLRAQAAEQMGVSVSAVSLKDGQAIAKGQALPYGEIARHARQWEVPSETPPLKSAEAYEYIGRERQRADLRPKVMAAPLFGIDQHAEGMLYGAIARSEHFDATFKGAKAGKAAEMPGVVQVVIEADFAGVVATSRVAAEQACEALQVDWEANTSWQQEDLEAMVQVGEGTEVTIQKEGRVSRALRNGELIEQSYRTPMAAHAHLEPNGALAIVESDSATIYIGTQIPQHTRTEVAERLGLEEAQVNILPQYLGGGFGRRLHTPNAMQAAVLARAVGRPVHCFWSRQAEFQNGYLRPLTHHVLRATLRGDGLIDAIEHNTASGDVAFNTPILPDFAKPFLGVDFGGWRGGMVQYKAIPNYRVNAYRCPMPLKTSWWRGLGLLANTFAIESFMDELAEQAGWDAVEFRLAQIRQDRQGRALSGVIRAAAEAAGWGQKLPDGHAHGFACSTDAHTPVAQVVEASLKGGQLKVHRVTCAIDPGLAINPDGIRAQCEGAIVQGLSSALLERMFVKDGQLLPTMYGAYPIAMMQHAPRDIEVLIRESGNKPSGVGEPPLGPIAAAVANAAYQLTGRRVREMPLGL